MLKEIRDNIPGRLFWFVNLIFWLVLNTLASSHTHRVNLRYERSSEWFDVWLTYLPWWGNWAIVAPIIVAVTAVIPFDSRKIVRFLLANVIACVVLLSFYWGLTIIEVAYVHGEAFELALIVGVLERLLASPMHMDFIIYLAIVFCGYAFSYYRSSKLQLIENEKLQRQIVQIELQSLKSQLNPHFLFNTLNTIASLIRLDDKNTAVRALNELSLMLRKVLENDNNQIIFVSQELEFIQSYLSIQKMRFGDKFTIEIDVNDACLRNEIPFMLLQPLVENAIQYGAQLETKQNIIKLAIDCDEENLKITLTNKVSESNDHKGFGIGLNNCRKRLQQLYPGQHQLISAALDDGYYQTYLAFPKEMDID